MGTSINDANTNVIARVLAARLLEEFPEWASAIRDDGSTDDSATGDAAVIEVTPPAHPTHRLDVVLRGNSVEVRYNDFKPPGPAEKMFVNFDRDPESASDGVVAFLRDLTEGRVVVARSPMGFLVRLLRRGRCQSLAAFRSAHEIPEDDVPRYLAVYRWVD